MDTRLTIPEQAGTEAAAIGFTLKLGQALHRYGTPAHRLEEMMGEVLARLGERGYFFSTPTGIFASFGEPHEQRTTLLRVEPGDVNLEKMAALDELAAEVIRGELSPGEGSERIDAIVAAPPRYGPVLSTLCFGLASGSFARVIGGGWREVAAAGAIGLALGALAVWSQRWRAHLYESAGALLASALALAAAAVLSPLSVSITTLAGLIVLIPGLTLTVAMRELATRNLVSGTARLMGALLVFFEIGFGVALGSQLYRALPTVSLTATAVPLAAWTEWAALLVSASALAVLFRARPRDAGWVVLGCAVSFAGARLGALLLGAENGAFVGAFALGAAGNLYTRRLRRPAAVLTVPGLMLLVPGSVGFSSLTHFLDHNAVTGIEAAFRMVIVAVALVTGLLLANVAVPPRRVL